MKNTTVQISTLCVRGKDLSFVDEMVAGGITDDGSPLIGDVSFDDNSDYSGIKVSEEQIDQYLASFS
jgi:hypothetical protein